MYNFVQISAQDIEGIVTMVSPIHYFQESEEIRTFELFLGDGV